METFSEQIRRESALREKLDNIGWRRDMFNLAGYVWGGGTLAAILADLTIGNVLGDGWKLGGNWANVVPMLVMAFVCLFISARITIYILKREKEIK